MDYYSVPRRILRGARQLVYPRRCPFCDRVLGSVPICPDCAAELEELRRKPGMRLDASQHYLGELTGAAAPFRYEGCVRRGILHTKYHAAPWAAVELGLWLAKLAFGSEMHMAGAEPVPELVEGMSLGYDCIVPVPASGRARGYNVPQLMAVPLARALGIPLYPKALGRTRAKRHQAGLPFEQRLANVAGLPGDGHGTCGGQKGAFGRRCDHYRCHGSSLHTGAAGSRCRECVCNCTCHC